MSGVLLGAFVRKGLCSRAPGISPVLFPVRRRGLWRCSPTGSGVYPSALREPRVLWKRNEEKVDKGEFASVANGGKRDRETAPQNSPDPSERPEVG